MLNSYKGICSPMHVLEGVSVFLSVSVAVSVSVSVSASASASVWLGGWCVGGLCWK